MMNELTVPCSRLSPHRRAIRDKMQLIGASVCIIVGYSESYQIYTGVLLMLPVIGLAIAILNVLFVRFYRTLTDRYGDKFELFLIRLNGIIMLTTGIGFQLAGSKYIFYAYYFLTLLFLIILPGYLYPVLKKRFVIGFTASGIITRGRFKSAIHKWQNVEALYLDQKLFRLKNKDNPKKSIKYYVELENTDLEPILGFIDEMNKQYPFQFNLKENIRK